MRFAARLQPGAYDLAFADPPYAGEEAAELAILFRKSPFARVFSVEHSAELAIEGDDTRRYGDTAITFFFAPSPPSL